MGKKYATGNNQLTKFDNYRPNNIKGIKSAHSKTKGHGHFDMRIQDMMMLAQNITEL